MKTILISTSKFGKAIPNYFKYLGDEFVKNSYSVIYIFDGRVKNLPDNSLNFKYYTYPSKRPTRFRDFIFLCKILKKKSPILCISNFGSTNIVTIASYLFRITHRINFLHTSPKQLKIDSKENYFFSWFLKLRKIFVLKMNTYF